MLAAWASAEGGRGLAISAVLFFGLVLFPPLENFLPTPLDGSPQESMLKIQCFFQIQNGSKQ